MYEVNKRDWAEWNDDIRHQQETIYEVAEKLGCTYEEALNYIVLYFAVQWPI